MIVVNAVLFAAAAFLGSFIVLGGAWLMVRGRAAAVRHLIWTGAFTALIGLPLAALLVPSRLVWLLPAAPVEPVAVIAAPVAPAPAFDTADVILVLAAIWLLGVVFHLLKLALGGIGLVRLYHRSVAHIPHGIDGTPFRGLQWQLRLRTSPGEAGPLTWGIAKPVVLLPKASVTWPRERLMSVLLHEAAHVRRRDCLCRLIAILTSALYWPNPLVWFAARAMRADAECAADDAVLTAGVKPTRYAEHLVGLAREFSGTAFAMTLSMAERRSLDTRVKSILDPTQSRSGVTKMDVLKLGVACVALTAGLAMMRPALAETTPPQASDAIAPAPAAKKHVVVHTVVRTHDDAQLADNADRTPPEPPAAEVAPEPPAPHVAPVPPVPPEPRVAPVPPAPPAPPAHALSITDHAMINSQAQAEARRAMAEARRALAQVNINQTVQVAMQQAEQALRDAKVDEAQAKKALAHVDVERIVARAMRRAEMALKKADEAQARAERRRVVIERRTENSNGDVTEEMTTRSEPPDEN